MCILEVWQFVPTECFDSWSNFCIVDTLHLAHCLQIDIPSKLPDHSLLTWTLSLHGDLVQLHSEGFTISTKLYKKVPENYMQSVEVQGQFNYLSDQLNSATSVDEIIAAYPD